MAKTDKKDELPPIIIKKVKKVAGGHHGGAWKVAYADFVTAMMAFFLLLWLLNVVTEDSRNAISNYFDPSHPRISSNTSGASGLMGGLSVTPEGAMATTVQDLSAPRPTGMTGQQTSEPVPKQEHSDATLKKLEEELRKEENDRFKKAKEELEKQLRENKDLAELAKNMIVDITPEGLRIQIIDQEGKPLFPLGSAEMYDYTRKLIEVVAKVIITMPNDISVRGHTDSFKYAPGAQYTNWELSADRANSSRRVLSANSVPDERLANVMGKADREHLVPENPLDPRNRRITILLLRETVEQAMKRGAFDPPEPEEEEDPEDDEELLPQDSGGTYQKTPGAVYFP